MGSIPSNVTQLPRPSATTLITCTWNQCVFLRLEKNVATTLKRNVRMYPRSTAIRYHTRSSIWNATRVMEVMTHTERFQVVAIHTKQLRVTTIRFQMRVQVIEVECFTSSKFVTVNACLNK